MFGKLFGRGKETEVEDDPEQDALRAIIGFLETHVHAIATKAAAQAMVDLMSADKVREAAELMESDRNATIDVDYYFYAAQVGLITVARAVPDADEHRRGSLSLTCLINAFEMDPDTAEAVILNAIRFFPDGDGEGPTAAEIETLDDQARKLTALRVEAAKAATFITTLIREQRKEFDLEDALIDPVAELLELGVE